MELHCTALEAAAEVLLLELAESFIIFFLSLSCWIVLPGVLSVQSELRELFVVVVEWAPTEPKECTGCTAVVKGC